MIKVDDLIEWAKLNAYGRSATIYNGWIRAEDLQALVYKIVEADPMEYEPLPHHTEKGESHDERRKHQSHT